MKREVKIIGLSYSQSQPNAYVVVLSEVNGHRKLPIVIKSQDAQTQQIIDFLGGPLGGQILGNI